jgi:catechol-2,3-dioxygenase
MRDWYLNLLEARVVHESPGGVFLTYDDEHHRVALADPVLAGHMAKELTGSSEGLIGAGGAPGLDAREEQGSFPHALRGLSHIAFTYDSLHELLGNYERLKGDSVTPTVTINHGTTTSMYYADPDGNQIELQVDNFPTPEEGVAFMESESFARNPIGVPFDPDAMLKRLREGEPAAGLIAPSW